MLQHHIYPKHLHQGTKLMSRNITGKSKVSVQILMINFEKL